MSRNYKIKMGDAEGIGGCDRDLRVLPVLSPPEMGSLVVDELARRGWTVGEDGVARKDLGEDTEAAVDPSTLHLRIESKASVSIEDEGYSVGDNREEGEARAREKIARRIEAGDYNQKAQEKADAKILATEGIVSAEVEEALKAATIKALQIKVTRIDPNASTSDETDANGRRHITMTMEV